MYPTEWSSILSLIHFQFHSNPVLCITFKNKTFLCKSITSKKTSLLSCDELYRCSEDILASEDELECTAPGLAQSYRRDRAVFRPVLILPGKRAQVMRLELSAYWGCLRSAACVMRLCHLSSHASKWPNVCTVKKYNKERQHPVERFLVDLFGEAFIMSVCWVKSHTLSFPSFLSWNGTFEKVPRCPVVIGEG